MQTTWHAYDLASGEYRAPLQMENWYHTDILCDAGRWNARLKAPNTAADANTIRVAVDRGRSLIVAVRGLVVLAAGIVWVSDVPEIAGAGLFSYLNRRNLNVQMTFAGVDQHDMVRTLVGYTNDNGGISIDVGSGSSGVLRDQLWRSWEAKNIGEAIRQKSALQHGFDFDVRCELDEGDVVRRLRLWTPRRGRGLSSESPRFVVGVNVVERPQQRSDDLITTRATALGVELVADTQERLVAQATRNDLLGGGYPVLDEVLDHPDVSISATLQAHADGYVAQWGQPQPRQVTMLVDPNHELAPWGSWDLGDDCYIEIPAGTDPWRPGRQILARRIVEHRWTINAAGERLRVVTAPRGTF